MNRFTLPFVCLAVAICSPPVGAQDATLAAPGDLNDPSGPKATADVAATPVQPEERPTLLVYQFTGNDVKEGVIRAATDFAASAFKSTDRFELLTMADVNTLVEIEGAKQAMGCEEAGCMAEIAGAVGADYVAVGEINAVGEIFAIKLSMLHPEDAKLVGIETLKVSRIELVPDLMADAASRLTYLAFDEPVPRALAEKPREVMEDNRARRRRAREAREEDEDNVFGSIMFYGGATALGVTTVMAVMGATVIGMSLYAVFTPSTSGWMKLAGRFIGPLSIYALVPVLAAGAFAGTCAGVGYVVE